MRLDKSNTAAIFEEGHGLIFTDGKLTGCRVGSSLIDFQLIKEFSGARMRFVQRWSLDNGVKYDMSLDDVKEILGEKLTKPADSYGEYHQTYRDGKSTVQLYFASSSNRFGNGETFHSHPIGRK